MYFVDGVIDSSRYYVLRLQDRASTRSVLMGIGFRERDVAFDFKNALNDYVRYVDRMATAEKAKLMRGESGDLDDKKDNKSNNKYDNKTHDINSNAVISLSQHRDMSIPVGQKITIKSKLIQTRVSDVTAAGTLLTHCKDTSASKSFIEKDNLPVGQDDETTPTHTSNLKSILSSDSTSPNKKNFCLVPPPPVKPFINPEIPIITPTTNLRMYGEGEDVSTAQFNGSKIIAESRTEKPGLQEEEEEEEEWGDFGSAVPVEI